MEGFIIVEWLRLDMGGTRTRVGRFIGVKTLKEYPDEKREHQCMELARALVFTLIFLQLLLRQCPVRGVDDGTPARAPIVHLCVTQFTSGIGRALQ